MPASRRAASTWARPPGWSSATLSQVGDLRGHEGVRHRGAVDRVGLGPGGQGREDGQVGPDGCVGVDVDGRVRAGRRRVCERRGRQVELGELAVEPAEQVAVEHRVLAAAEPLDERGVDEPPRRVEPAAAARAGSRRRGAARRAAGRRRPPASWLTTMRSGWRAAYNVSRWVGATASVPSTNVVHGARASPTPTLRAAAEERRRRRRARPRGRPAVPASRARRRPGRSTPPRGPRRRPRTGRPGGSGPPAHRGTRPPGRRSRGRTPRRRGHAPGERSRAM